MWACRTFPRKDFSFEGYRWQPEHCKTTEFEESEFLKRMQDKTIAFIGDSLGRQQFQSLMCMASGGEWRMDVADVGYEFGLVKAPGAIRPDGWAYRFTNTNTTILYYWSASLADLVPVNATNRQTDVRMLLNTGHHWNRGKLKANRWVMYINGEPLEDKGLVDLHAAKNLTVRSVARWLDQQLPSHPRNLKVFFRTISPRHYRDAPMTRGSKVSKDESSDVVIASAVEGTRIKLLDVTALSELRDEAHISNYSAKTTNNVSDCLHWCLPGVPDTWNELLAAQI
ncbi:unnamed protein product [Linum tenue]|uniref:Trichome birefringence-like C-terminal domain-containing protein n=1 Tax=Linum tenue TaxID=586396 RepID=A0AAV0LY50_9ROSI|nr:unnamed protein product [Linum tenue]